MSRHPIFVPHIAIPLVLTIAVMSGLSWLLHYPASLNQTAFFAIGFPILAAVIAFGYVSERRHSRRSQRATKPDSQLPPP